MGRKSKPNPAEKGQTTLWSFRTVSGSTTPPNANPENVIGEDSAPPPHIPTVSINDLLAAAGLPTDNRSVNEEENPSPIPDNTDPVDEPEPEPDIGPPSPKMPKLEDMSTEQRKTVEHYLKAFDWLRFVKPGIVVCAKCREYQVFKNPGCPTPWSSGFSVNPAIPDKKDTGAWRSNTFRTHEKAKEHVKACTNRPHAPPQTLDDALRKMFQGNDAATKRALGIALFTVQQELPIRKAENVHNLILTLFSSEQSAVGFMLARHKSNWSTYEFIKALNADVQRRQIERLQNAVSFTLHADESTDICARKFLLLYVQYVTVEEDGSTKIHPTEFLTVLKLQNATADTISQKIIRFLDAFDIDKKKMVMFTSDGAAVMVGKRSGVAAKLREIVGSHLISYHCVSHREALAMRHAYEGMPDFSNLDVDLRALIGFMAQGKQRAGLEVLQEALEMDYIEIPKIIDIRWLARVRSIDAIIRDYPTILKFLEAEGAGHAQPSANMEVVQAYGYLQSFSKMNKIWIIHRLADLLEPYDALNKASQNRHLHPYKIRELTDSVINSIRGRYRKERVEREVDGEIVTEKVIDIWEGDNIRKLRSCLSQNGDEQPRIVPTEPPDQWEEICHEADKRIYKLAKRLLKELEKRCGTGTESAILKETRIFDPHYGSMDTTHLWTARFGGPYEDLDIFEFDAEDVRALEAFIGQIPDV